MAITDNTFTPEEVDAAVAANPALKAHLVGAVTKLGYVARTTDEENTFVGSKVKEIHDGYDRDVFDVSGIQKDQNEKSYDYTKRVLKAQKEAATPLQAKIAELEKAIADGNGDATIKAQLEALQGKEEKYQQDIKDRDDKLFQKDVVIDIRDGLRAVKLNEAVPANLRKLAIDHATAAIVAMAKPHKEADGTETVVYMRDGKVALNKDSKAATAADLLQEMLVDVLETGQPGTGGGAGAPGTGGAGGSGSARKALPTSLPSTVKTQGHLMDYLKEFGLAAGTADYDKAWDDLKGSALPLR